MATTNERLDLLEAQVIQLIETVGNLSTAYVANLTFKRLDNQRTGEREAADESLQAQIDALTVRVSTLENA